MAKGEKKKMKEMNDGWKESMKREEKGRKKMNTEKEIEG